MVDLADGQPSALLTRDKLPIPPGDEEQMRGEGRLAVYHPALVMLYTLYTHQPDHQHTRNLIAGSRSQVHAFVHSLSLDQRWAYCVDLPAPFGEAPAAGHTVAISPDSRFLYVIDTGSGTIAVISTESLSVTRTRPGLRAPDTIAHAAATDDRVLIGAGRTIASYDPTGRALATWSVAGPISGLALSRDSQRLYAGQPDSVRWFDPASGRSLGEAATPGLAGLLRVL